MITIPTQEQEESIQSFIIGKEKINLPSFVHDMIIDTKNSK